MSSGWFVIRVVFSSGWSVHCQLHRETLKVHLTQPTLPPIAASAHSDLRITLLTPATLVNHRSSGMPAITDTSHHRYHPCRNTLTRILTKPASPVSRGDKPLVLMTLILGEKTAEREEMEREEMEREGAMTEGGTALWSFFFFVFFCGRCFGNRICSFPVHAVIDGTRGRRMRVFLGCVFF